MLISLYTTTGLLPLSASYSSAKKCLAHTFNDTRHPRSRFLATQLTCAGAYSTCMHTVWRKAGIQCGMVGCEVWNHVPAWTPSLPLPPLADDSPKFEELADGAECEDDGEDVGDDDKYADMQPGIITMEEGEEEEEGGE